MKVLLQYSSKKIFRMMKLILLSCAKILGEEYENFGEKYYYESDEQSKDVQQRAIRELPKISIKKWTQKFRNKSA